MRKAKIYLDTSVISFYFAEDAPEKMAITRQFFEEVLADSNYEIYLSYLVIDELSNTTDIELPSKLLGFAQELSAEILKQNEEVGEVAKLFVQENIIPVKYQDDAIHLALALVNGMDYIVSWNFKHLVKPKTRKSVRAFAIKEGYKEIEITTPEEVASDEN